VAGIADAFAAAGLPVFGPSKAAAQLEGSKAFAKELMRQANVPTADYWVFDDPEEAIRFVDERESAAFVVKADGLAAGKGVTVCKTRGDIVHAIREAMV